MTSLEPGTLDWSAVMTLSSTIRNSDRIETGPRGPGPAFATVSTLGGEAYTAMREDGDLLGAYGFTSMGTIWSLWRPLSRAEAKAVLIHTPLWVRSMVSRSGYPRLFNWVHVKNKTSIRWLHASGCFDVHPEVEYRNNLRCFQFHTRLLEELP